jgi:hypothetical protein
VHLRKQFAQFLLIVCLLCALKHSRTLTDQRQIAHIQVQVTITSERAKQRAKAERKEARKAAGKSGQAGVYD